MQNDMIFNWYSNMVYAKAFQGTRFIGHKMVQVPSTSLVTYINIMTIRIQNMMTRPSNLDILLNNDSKLKLKIKKKKKRKKKATNKIQLSILGQNVQQRKSRQLYELTGYYSDMENGWPRNENNLCEQGSTRGKRRRRCIDSEEDDHPTITCFTFVLLVVSTFVSSPLLH